jgi:tetratricopeptide (TPR) repeat protein/transglutaminase-like putative cysteine protease
MTHIGFVSSVLAVALAGQAAVQVQPSKPPVAPAQPPDYSKEAFVVEQSKSRLVFENDGTGRREAYVRIKVQSEAGVQQWGQLVLGYNAATERIEIPFVRVRKADGTSVSAPADAIQDLTSPVQREAPVYTDFRQKHVTVPSLRPGETLEFSAVTTIHTPFARGHFWTEYSFQKIGIVLDEQLEIDLPVNRSVTLKTQPGADPVKRQADGRTIYRWTSSHLTTEKEDKKEKEETDDAAKAEEPRRADVRLTTFQSWDEVGRWYSELEKNSRTPTPEVRKKATELVAGKTTDADKLQALYDFVAPNFRYVSISLGSGRYQPRSAHDVLRDQYGDCKDKHTLLASLMESVGLHASAVLIHSAIKLDPDFPSPSQFDHVITKAAIGPEPAWLDATTEIAPYRLLSPNLRKKQALVVSSTGTAQLEETPADPPTVNLQVQELDATLGDLGKLTGRIKLTMRGDIELFMRTIFRRAPAAQWKIVLEKMNEAMGIGGEVSELKVTDPAATHEPFVIEYQVSTANFIEWTKRKVDLKLPLSDLSLAAHEDGKGEIDLGSPSEVQYRLRLELGQGYQARAPVPVSVSRDYGEYRGSYTLEGNVFTAERTLKLRARSLPADRSGDYAAFRRVVVADDEQALALEVPASSSTLANSDLKAADLNRSAYEALRAGNHAQAATLLKRVVELEPKDRTAWNNLGLAYLGLRQVDSAIDAFKKQLEINPYHEQANTNLGRSYLQLRKYAEAEAAFKKQLEVNPLDKYAHGILGHQYVEMERYEDAIPVLEKAISLSSEDASLHVEIGTAYLNLNKNEQALASFARAAELSPTPNTWNNVAYQLALKGVHLDRAQQYAESAVAAVTAESRNLTISRVTARELGLVESLAAYWDTLGWVLFAKGELTGAEKLVAASWWIGQHSEVGDHLAQIYEKQGRREEAIKTYAAALLAERPAQATRGRLAALVGRESVEAILKKHAGVLATMRAVNVPASAPVPGTADFFLLLGSGSDIEAASFISGDDKLREMTDGLRKARVGSVFPNESPAKLIRRGTLTCETRTACRLTLVPSSEVQPGQQ